MRRSNPAALGLSLCAALGCAVANVAGELELVESVPVETAMGHAELRDASPVWIEMIDGARKSIDLAMFYGAHVEGEALGPVLVAVEAAAARGVKVRVVFDGVFAGMERSVIDRWAARDDIEVRIIEAETLYGGVMHAKYFVVDGSHVFVGSQNLDWRALDHIVELGVRVKSDPIAAAFEDIFARDWALAAGERYRGRTRPAEARIEIDGSAHQVSARFSPERWVGHPVAWDWPELRATFDGARRSIDLQALSYDIEMRDGSQWAGMDEALRRAEARGVTVRLLVSHWNLEDRSAVQALRRLDQLGGVDVRVVHVPEHSSGPIPYARVSHRKLIVVDELMCWIGTSNFSGDYFLRSRNAGLVIRGETLPARVGGLFSEAWADADRLP